MSPGKILYFVTEDWYFCSHRLPLAIAAKKAGYEVTVVTRVRAHGKDIRKAGLRLIPFENERSGMNLLREVGNLARLVIIYYRERPDLVHHVALKPVLYGSIAARIARVPNVVNALAGMGWLFNSGEGLARLMTPFVRLAIGFLLRSGIALVQNHDDIRFLEKLGVPRAQIKRIAGSGVDLVRFRAQPEPDSLPIVLLPARLLWVKGVGEFVGAARLLIKRKVAAKFILAGEPDVRNSAAIDSRQINRWVTEGVIEHLGWVKDMPTLLAGIHIVCLPSYREGLPKSLIEAAASGRAIVTTDVPGCRDVVRNGDNGLLVRPYEVASLASAIEILIKDHVLRKAMGERGRTRAENEFGLDFVVEQTLKLYQEILA